MRKPVSPQQLAANRANAARSTGPASSEGKSRSALNSVKHGFTAYHHPHRRPPRNRQSQDRPRLHLSARQRPGALRRGAHGPRPTIHVPVSYTHLYQARIAARQAEGSVSRLLAPIKEKLLELIALLEAGIDFAEDDIGVAPAREIEARIGPIRDGVTRLAGSFQWGGLVTGGLKLAIVGRPNVGKSSLFNRLLEQDRAIVTDIPGTTRDLVSETASIGGIPVKLYDTAGIREAAETVEALGIERSYQAMADADVTLVVVDGSQPPDEQDQVLICLLYTSRCV